MLTLIFFFFFKLQTVINNHRINTFASKLATNAKAPPVGEVMKHVHKYHNGIK